MRSVRSHLFISAGVEYRMYSSSVMESTLMMLDTSSAGANDLSSYKWPQRDCLVVVALCAVLLHLSTTLREFNMKKIDL